MSASITLQQTNSTYDDADGQPVYVSENIIEASEGIPLALVVFAVETSAYSHVASTHDILTYPDTRAAAVAAGLDYYRQVAVTREFDNLTDAQDFALHVRSRLQFLSNDYPATTDDFVGSATYTYVTSEI